MKRIGHRIEHKILAILIVILLSTIQAFAMEEIKISKTEGCDKIGEGYSYGKTYVCTVTKDLKDIKILIDSGDITLNGNMKSLIGQKGHAAILVSNTKTIIKNVVIKNFKEIKGFSTGIDITENNIHVESNTIIGNDKGIVIRDDYNEIIGNTVNSNKIGISIDSGKYNKIKGNVIKDNNENGIILKSNGNRIYDNYFYNTNNFETTNSNYWNIEGDKAQSGTNIIKGPKIGGNFWGKPTNDGYSQTCADVNKDGICDKKYQMGQNNVDNLPLKPIKDIQICVGNTRAGQKITVAPLPNMRVYFPQISECGNVVATKISRELKKKGYKAKEFYDITFYDMTGKIKSIGARIYIGYDTNEKHLDMFHFENNDWMLKTNKKPEPKPAELPSFPLNYKTVIVGDSSLSPFAVTDVDKTMGEGGEGGGGKGIKKCTVCHGIPEDCTTSCHSLYESGTNFSTSGKSFNMPGFIILTISLLVISILILIRRKDKI